MAGPGELKCPRSPALLVTACVTLTCVCARKNSARMSTWIITSSCAHTLDHTDAHQATTHNPLPFCCFDQIAACTKAAASRWDRTRCWCSQDCSQQSTARLCVHANAERWWPRQAHWDFRLLSKKAQKNRQTLPNVSRLRRYSPRKWTITENGPLSSSWASDKQDQKK